MNMQYEKNKQNTNLDMIETASRIHKIGREFCLTFVQ